MFKRMHIQTIQKNSSPNHSFLCGMKKTVVLFNYQTVAKKSYICSALVPSLNQDWGEVQMGEFWTSLEPIRVSDTPLFFRNAKYCKFQRMSTLPKKKKFLQVWMVSYYHLKCQILGRGKDSEQQWKTLYSTLQNHLCELLTLASNIAISWTHPGDGS